MKRFITAHKKAVAAVAATAIVVGTGGAALAYWSTSGSGSGTGTAASDLPAGTLTLTGTYVAADLYPGHGSTVTVKAANSSTSDAKVGTVSSSAMTVDTTHANNGCLASWFTLPDITGGDIIVAGATAQTLSHTGTLSMANAHDATTGNAIDQNACKGATISFTLTSI